MKQFFLPAICLFLDIIFWIWVVFGTPFWIFVTVFVCSMGLGEPKDPLVDIILTTLFPIMIYVVCALIFFHLKKFARKLLEANF
jgi:uncharacterized membrane protein YccC